MFSTVKLGDVVVVECVHTMYVGVVARTTPSTIVLGEFVVIHTIHNLAAFYAGRFTNNAVGWTVSPRNIEISWAAVQSIQPYPAEFFAQMQERPSVRGPDRVIETISS